MIPIFYDPRQQVDDNTSYSPSAGKPRLVVERWLNSGLPVEIRSYEPLTADQIALAHDPSYVEGIITGRINNGFGNTLPSVAQSLLWTTGSVVAATRYAAQTRALAASPTSGFHHACYSSGGGFCTFNGLVIAAQMLKREGLIERIGIIDVDCHAGNGTDDIIERLGLDFIQHWSFGNQSFGHDPAHRFLQELPEVVASMSDVDVVIAQLGADMSAHDPLGGVLDNEEMRLRDRIILTGIARLGIGCCWVNAGGYQNPISKVVDLHMISMEEAQNAQQSKKAS
jgi:acetoin utilization deacetylase AcuC-like enzyme